jgi:hypothetical protein
LGMPNGGSGAKPSVRDAGFGESGRTIDPWAMLDLRNSLPFKV